MSPAEAAALRASVLAAHIQEAVAAAPPFTTEQIERLRALLPAPKRDPLGPQITAALRARPQRVSRRGI